jgi:hypothetical protein
LHTTLSAQGTVEYAGYTSRMCRSIVHLQISAPSCVEDDAISYTERSLSHLKWCIYDCYYVVSVGRVAQSV